jgi:hypothetical protein
MPVLFPQPQDDLPDCSAGGRAEDHADEGKQDQVGEDNLDTDEVGIGIRPVAK